MGVGAASRAGAAPLALTMGDPAGIGPEISIKAWLARAERPIPPFALIAAPETIRLRARRLGLDADIEIVSDIRRAPEVFSARLPVIPLDLAEPSEPGAPSPANAPAVIKSIEMAVAFVETGSASAVVTNPVSKATLKAVGFEHPGHTEFLAALARRHHAGEQFHPVMMLASQELRVVPLTIHIPLADVPRSITPKLIRDTVEVIDRTLGRPRIAVAGLNPHAGEDGTMGREECEVIAPTIEELRSEGFDVRGPLPADTMFHAAARATYDIAIAMYHDQALIPIKTLAFDRGVNVTLGLPFVRTSPDHGTAFDIAARGIASPESLIEALVMAEGMARARRDASAS